MQDTRQETCRLGKCYANTTSHSNLNSNSTYMPMVNTNEIKYILPGPNQKNERRASADITKQLQRDFADVLVD